MRNICIVFAGMLTVSLLPLISEALSHGLYLSGSSREFSPSGFQGKALVLSYLLFPNVITLEGTEKVVNRLF